MVLYYSIFYISLVPGWKFYTIGGVTARTTLSLWHQLYVEKKIAHDFSDILSLSNEYTYIAASRHDEIRSIGCCIRPKLSSLSLISIAHAPYHTEAGTVLIMFATDNNILIEWKYIKSQPRWFLEGIFLQHIV